MRMAEAEVRDRACSGATQTVFSLPALCLIKMVLSFSRSGPQMKVAPLSDNTVFGFRQSPSATVTSVATPAESTLPALNARLSLVNGLVDWLHFPFDHEGVLPQPACDSV